MNQRQRPDPLNQVREFWDTIVVHRWSILPSAALLAAIATVVITLIPNSYTASTSVLFDPQKLPDRYVAPTVTTDPAQKLNTLTQEVLSASRLEQINQQLHPHALSQQEVVDQMRKSITIEMKPSPEHEMSSFVITYTGREPQVVAATANRLAQSFIDWDLANRQQQAANTNAFMSTQLEDAKEALDAEEAKINDYKLKHAGELPEQLQFNMQALSLLHTNLQGKEDAINRLTQERTMLTQAPEATRATSAPSERDRVEADRRALETELAQLSAQFTAQHPDVVTTRDRLKAVTEQLNHMDAGASSTAASSSKVRLQIISSEIDRLQAEQKKLVERINQTQSQIDATALRGQEIDVLSRNYANAREQYQGLLDKKFHSEMAMDLERQQKATRFTVDPAQVPERPVKPNRLLLLAIALPLCGIFPAGIAIAGAELRGTVNSERALQSLLPKTARILGQIPMIDTSLAVRKRRRLAFLSILGSLTCCGAAAAFLLTGAANLQRNHDRDLVPVNVNAVHSSP